VKQVLSRRTIAWGIAIVFLLFTLVSVFFGNPGVRTAGPGGTVVKPVVPLEAAIRIIKTYFNIPVECTDFTSGYNGDLAAQSWTLQWTAPGRQDLGCNAQVDAATGEVLSFNSGMPGVNGSGISLREPAVSMEQARVIASHLLSLVAVRHLAELRPAQDEVNIQGGPVSYTFHWERVVNGVPFPANGVSIQVSGADGRVSGYYLSWMQATFPDAAKAISPERAREVFENAGMLELQYYQPGSPTATAGTKQPVLLVYRLVHSSDGVIDAIAGVPLVSNVNVMPKGDPSLTLNGALRLSLPDAVPALSPEEIKEVRKIAGFLSQDGAAAAARKWLPAAANLVLQSANLTIDNQTGAYIWELGFRAAAPGRQDGLSARVNALTGELIGFNYFDPTSAAWPWQIGYLSRDSARKAAEEFLKKIQPQRFQEVKLEPVLNPGPPLRIGYPPAQHFNFQRMVNGIPFPDNYMAVEVDTHARRLVQYELNWTDLNFPAFQGTLGLKQAYDAFLKNQPQALIYVRNDQTGIISLVYQPQAQPGMPATGLLDARTGAPLDGNGRMAAPLTAPRRFTDLAGVPQAREIELLGQAGLFGEYGDAFHPNEPITAAALLRAMLQLHEGPGNYAQMSGQDLMKQARDRGWLREDLPPEGRVAREELCRIVVRMLGLERAAEARGIYRLPFDDAAAISPDAAGYVALAWGLGIIKEEGSLLKPEQPVSRAEAAAVLFRAFK